MDELKMLGTTLTGPDPSPEAVDRSRHRLQNVMRGGHARPRRKKRWIAAGTVGLVATGAAAAVAVSGLSAPDDHKAGHKEPVLSGQQVMLAAATAAESKPASSGTYWHTKFVDGTGKDATVTETWIARDGRTWLSVAPGMVSRVGRRPLLVTTKLDYDDIQRLPTDPDRLKAALLRSSTLPTTHDQRTLTTINLLQSVLAAPAPPKVRGAAYRALAALPGITNLGRTAGGYRLKISYLTGTHVDGTETVVVDPRTTQLRVEGWAGFGDGGLPVGPSRTTSGWTDRLSGRIVPWSEQEPYIEQENRRRGEQNH